MKPPSPTSLLSTAKPDDSCLWLMQIEEMEAANLELDDNNTRLESLNMQLQEAKKSLEVCFAWSSDACTLRLRWVLQCPSIPCT